MKRVLLFFSFLLCGFILQAQKVGLVLSGGGAKGMTHIGIIRALEENNIPIDYMLAQDYGIMTRAGAHCAPLMHEALGTKSQGAVRFSFSYFNTEEEIERAAEAVQALAEEA